MTDEQAVLTERRGRVLIITLNRPDAMNAINGALSSQLMEAIELLDGDAELTAGVLTGAGRGFCSGMDLKAFAAGEDIGPFVEFARNGSKKPLIGAVEGFAIAGGLEIALTCDLLVAGRSAQFAIREVKVGLFAAAGGLFRLPGRVGHATAMEMALTGDSVTADAALGAGLISEVTDDGDALDAAVALAERIAQNAPLAVAASKQLVRAASQGIEESALWKMQEPLMATVFTSNDAREGPRAFAEKRAPDWTGT